MTMRQFATSSFAFRLPIVFAWPTGRWPRIGSPACRQLIPFCFSLKGKVMKLKVLTFAAIGVLAAQSTWAADIRVSGAWVRATMPGQPVSGAYMQLQSDADARLVGVSSPAVPRVEVHEMSMDGGVMRMREVKAIDLPKGKAVSLEPGGYHIMLMNLKKPIAAGDVIPLTLIVESGGKQQKVEVKAVARPMNMGGGAMQH
jgi:copper(I)-binding protein